MNKCNNCTKFLTCDRRECKQITFLQAEQLDRIKIKPQYLKIDSKALEKSIEEFSKAIYQFEILVKKRLEEDTKNFTEGLNKEKEKWTEK